MLVNNAGLQHVAPLPDFDPDPFSLTLRVMLEAPFRLARRILPHMYRRGWGRVVNISSAHGLRASPFKAAYVTARHGLEGLSKVDRAGGRRARRHEQPHQPCLPITQQRNSPGVISLDELDEALRNFLTSTEPGAVGNDLFGPIPASH